jgi:hypothetical protein
MGQFYLNPFSQYKVTDIAKETNAAVTRRLLFLP